ncbi:hypothetical protein [Janibacter melonis]|nr:hypothetical protein [Janibacter melonis]
MTRRGDEDVPERDVGRRDEIGQPVVDHPLRPVAVLLARLEERDERA